MGWVGIVRQGGSDGAASTALKHEPPPSPDVTHTFLTFNSPSLMSHSYVPGTPGSESLRLCFGERSPTLLPGQACAPWSAMTAAAASHNGDPPPLLAPIHDPGGGGGGGGGGGPLGTPSLPSAQWLLSPLLSSKDSPFGCLRSSPFTCARMSPIMSPMLASCDTPGLAAAQTTTAATAPNGLAAAATTPGGGPGGSGPGSAAKRKHSAPSPFHSFCDEKHPSDQAAAQRKHWAPSPLQSFCERKAGAAPSPFHSFCDAAAAPPPVPALSLDEAASSATAAGPGPVAGALAGCLAGPAAVFDQGQSRAAKKPCLPPGLPTYPNSTPSSLHCASLLTSPSPSGLSGLEPVTSRLSVLSAGYSRDPPSAASPAPATRSGAGGPGAGAAPRLVAAHAHAAAQATGGGHAAGGGAAAAGGGDEVRHLGSFLSAASRCLFDFGSFTALFTALSRLRGFVAWLLLSCSV